MENFGLEKYQNKSYLNEYVSHNIDNHDHEDETNQNFFYKKVSSLNSPKWQSSRLLNTRKDIIAAENQNTKETSPGSTHNKNQFKEEHKKIEIAQEKVMKYVDKINKRKTIAKRLAIFLNSKTYVKPKKEIFSKLSNDIYNHVKILSSISDAKIARERLLEQNGEHGARNGHFRNMSMGQKLPSQIEPDLIEKATELLSLNNPFFSEKAKAMTQRNSKQESTIPADNLVQKTVIDFFCQKDPGLSASDVKIDMTEKEQELQDYYINQQRSNKFYDQKLYCLDKIYSDAAEKLQNLLYKKTKDLKTKGDVPFKGRIKLKQHTNELNQKDLLKSETQKMNSADKGFGRRNSILCEQTEDYHNNQSKNTERLQQNQRACKSIRHQSSIFSKKSIQGSTQCNQNSSLRNSNINVANNSELNDNKKSEFITSIPKDCNLGMSYKEINKKMMQKILDRRNQESLAKNPGDSQLKITKGFRGSSMAINTNNSGFNTNRKRSTINQSKNPEFNCEKVIEYASKRQIDHHDAAASGVRFLKKGEQFDPSVENQVNNKQKLTEGIHRTRKIVMDGTGSRRLIEITDHYHSSNELINKEYSRQNTSNKNSQMYSAERKTIRQRSNHKKTNFDTESDRSESEKSLKHENGPHDLMFEKSKSIKSRNSLASDKSGNPDEIFDDTDRSYYIKIKPSHQESSIPLKNKPNYIRKSSIDGYAPKIKIKPMNHHIKKNLDENLINDQRNNLSKESKFLFQKKSNPQSKNEPSADTLQQLDNKNGLQSNSATITYPKMPTDLHSTKDNIKIMGTSTLTSQLSQAGLKPRHEKIDSLLLSESEMKPGDVINNKGQSQKTQNFEGKKINKKLVFTTTENQFFDGKNKGPHTLNKSESSNPNLFLTCKNFDKSPRLTSRNKGKDIKCHDQLSAIKNNNHSERVMSDYISKIFSTIGHSEKTNNHQRQTRTSLLKQTESRLYSKSSAENDNENHENSVKLLKNLFSLVKTNQEGLKKQLNGIRSILERFNGDYDELCSGLIELELFEELRGITIPNSMLPCDIDKSLKKKTETLLNSKKVGNRNSRLIINEQSDNITSYITSGYDTTDL